MSLADQLFHSLGAKQENARSPTDLYVRATNLNGYGWRKTSIVCWLTDSLQVGYVIGSLIMRGSVGILWFTYFGLHETSCPILEILKSIYCLLMYFSWNIATSLHKIPRERRREREREREGGGGGKTVCCVIVWLTSEGDWLRSSVFLFWHPNINPSVTPKRNEKINKEINCSIKH